MQCVDTLGLDLVFVIQMDTLIYGDGVLLFFNDVPRVCICAKSRRKFSPAQVILFFGLMMYIYLHENYYSQNNY